MPARSTLRTLLAAAAVAAFVPAAALSANTGSSSSAPSASAPRYDPAEEYQNGLDALNEGDYRAAERAFDRVADVVDDNADVQFLLGVAREGRERWRPARRAYQAALRIDENHIGALRGLGVVQAQLGNEDEAGEALATLQARLDACAGTCADAEALASAAAAVQAALGGEDSAALETPLSRLAFASAEAGDTAYLSAVGLINAGDYEGAIEALAIAREAFGPHPDVLTYLGFAHRKLGRYDEAETYYAAALQAAPGHRGATEYLGELKVERGDLPAAERLLAQLESTCSFGCAEADELRRWIDEAR
ncbi:MAG: tetratricopeptide repeat protein [Maricaulaceae bacterium]